MLRKKEFDVPFLLVHVSFFILFVLGMVIYRAYSVSAVLLVLLSFYVIAHSYKDINFKAESSLVYGLLTYVVVNILVNLVAGHSSRDYESSVRVLLIIPVIYLMVRVGFNRTFFILAMGLGGVAMGLVAAYDVYIMKAARAGVFHLRFGYIASWQVIVSLISLLFLDKRAEYKIAIVVVSLLGIVGGIVAAILSGTRGSWLVLLMALFVLSLYAMWQASPQVKKWMLAMLGVVIIAGVGLFSTDNYVSKRMDQAISEITRYKPNSKSAATSLGMRFEVWRVSTMIIEEHPFTGIGTKNFHKSLQKLVDEKTLSPFILQLKHFHNDVIEEAVTAGVLVAIALVFGLYLMPFIVFARRLVHHNKDVRYYSLLGCMLVMAWVMFGLTDVFITTNQGGIYYLVNMAIIWGGMRYTESQSV